MFALRRHMMHTCVRSQKAALSLRAQRRLREAAATAKGGKQTTRRTSRRGNTSRGDQARARAVAHRPRVLDGPPVEAQSLPVAEAFGGGVDQEEDDDDDEEGRRSCVVALCGAPNSGKSTLVNALVGEHVSIVSPKMQTTRERVLGIAHDDPTQTQLVFADTPGLMRSSARTGKRRLMRPLMVTASEALDEADCALVVLDASRSWGADEREAVVRCAGLNEPIPTALVLNKCDLVRQDDPAATTHLETGLSRLLEGLRPDLFAAQWAVSALHKRHLDPVWAWCVANAQHTGGWMYPRHWTTDTPALRAVEEAIRERVFRRLNQELPYAVTQETTGWWHDPDTGGLHIHHELTVPRLHHYRTLVGAGGKTIAWIRDGAQQAISKMLGADCLLILRVRRAS